MQLLLWFAVAAGHIGLWCAIFNRTHATAMPRGWRKLVERLIILVTGVPLLAIPVWFAWSRSWAVTVAAAHSNWLTLYLILCSFAFCFFLLEWLERILTLRRPAEFARVSSERMNVERVTGKRLTSGTLANCMRFLPGNQATSLSVERHRIDLSRGASDVEVVRIAQFSDLHFTGSIDRGFFEHVVGQSNAFRPDLVFLTGDIVDNPECLDWIVPVLGKIESGFGRYYVLGNHDRLIENEEMLRQTIERTGFLPASGKWNDVRVRKSRMRITGNELPWYTAANRLTESDSGETPGATRLLLTHSPDQIGWAQQHRVDLVFAGHTHGGQIRLPVVGAIIVPSRHGVRYASGAFRVGKTLMHVSRGLSGDDPVRLRCPPELGLFEVTLPASSAGIED